MNTLKLVGSTFLSLILSAVVSSGTELTSSKILYVEMVYEPGATSAEAHSAYWRDRAVFEKICRAHGGDHLQIIKHDGLPEDNGDGLWKIQVEACLEASFPTEVALSSMALPPS